MLLSFLTWYCGGSIAWRKRRIQTEVSHLAKELADAKQALIDEIVIHERVVQDLKQSNAELRKSQERTALMLRSVQMASGSLELNQVLERIAEMLASATGMNYCGIYLMDEERNILMRHAGTSSLTNSQPELIKNLQIDPDSFHLFKKHWKARNRSFARMPGQTRASTMRYSRRWIYAPCWWYPSV